MLHRSCVCSLALVALLAGPWLSSQGRGAAKPPRPMRGNAQGMITGTIAPNGLIVQVTGYATNLGRFTREERLFVNADGSFTGTLVFTAATGEQLKADFQGAFTSPTTAEGTYTFNGGTGRFADATGTADFQASTDGVNVAVAFAGTISY